MRARKCDRCGRFYDHYQGEGKFIKTGQANAVQLIDKYMDNTGSPKCLYDLCPDCMKKLEKFLKIDGGAE